MKRKVLAVIIPALLASGVANAVEIYNKDGDKLNFSGRASALHYFSNNSDFNGDKTSARLGVDGETKIDDMLTGYGKFQFEMKANRVEGNSNGQYIRLAFAGLKFGDYGSLDYGRNYGVMYDTAAWTDVLTEFGGDSAQTDVYMLQRATGVLTYRNTDFFGLVDGLNFALQYQGKNEGGSADAYTANNASSRKAIYDNGDGYGFSASYDVGWGVTAAASYFNSKRTDRVRNGGASDDKIADLGATGKRAEGFGTALKYDANNVYLAASYSQYLNTITYGNGNYGTPNKSVNYSAVANTARNFEVVAQYQFDFGLRPSLAYVQSKGYGLTNSRDGNSTADLVKYADIGAIYYFNKNMSTYVDYKINLLKKDKVPYGVCADNVVGVGLVYQF